MVSIHIEGKDSAEVQDQMRALLGTQTTAVGGTVENSKPAKAAKEAKTASEPKEPKPANSVVSFDDVKIAITQYLDKFGKPAIIKFFAESFAPATKGSEIPEARYGEFVKLVAEKIAAAPVS